MNISQNNNIVYINTLHKQDTDNVRFYMKNNVFEIGFEVINPTMILQPSVVYSS